MIEIVKEIINYYVKNKKEPSINEISIVDKGLLVERWCIFVTFFKNWEIRGSAWNVKELEVSIIHELIKSSIKAFTDSRFEALKLEEINDLKIRIDILEDRKMLEPGQIKTLDPIKSWVIVIRKDYEKLAVILPNINHILMSWEDFISVLKFKLWEDKFEEKDYIIYEVKSKIITSY